MRKSSVIGICTILLMVGWHHRDAIAQQSGGAFVPGFNYVINGLWNFTHSGGVIGTNTGPAAFKINGTAVYEIAEGGNVALDGSNPTSVTMTPLATIDGCSVTMMGSTAPGADPSVYSVNVSATAGQLDIYAWKPTASGDTALVASTSTRQVSYSCVGR